MWRLFFVLALSAGSFAFWHSGGRAANLCERERFVHSGDLSLWPPGADCTYGLPSITDTLLNPWFFGTLIFVVVAGLLLGGAVSRR